MPGYLVPVDVLIPAFGGVVVLFLLLGGLCMASSWPVGPDVRCHKGAALLLARAGRQDRSRAYRRLASEVRIGIAIGSAVLVPLASLAYRSSKARA